MSDKYILMGKLAVPCNDLLTWARWFETAEKHVAQTTVGPLRVSTVFLGIDHRFGGADPMLFETMIFGGLEDSEWSGGYQERYSSWVDAETGHAQAVALAEAQLAAAKEAIKATPPSA